jgi:hypothetical protein
LGCNWPRIDLNDMGKIFYSPILPMLERRDREGFCV